MLSKHWLLRDIPNNTPEKECLILAHPKPASSTVLPILVNQTIILSVALANNLDIRFISEFSSPTTTPQQTKFCGLYPHSKGPSSLSSPSPPLLHSPEPPPTIPRLQWLQLTLSSFLLHTLFFSEQPKEMLQNASLIWIHCKQPTFPSTGEWVNKLGCIHTVEYFSAMKRN